MEMALEFAPKSHGQQLQSQPLRVQDDPRRQPPEREQPDNPQRQPPEREQPDDPRHQPPEREPQDDPRRQQNSVLFFTEYLREVIW